MANFAASALNALQLQYFSQFTEYELRTGLKPITVLANSNNPILFGQEQLDRLKQSVSRATSVYYLLNPTFTTGSARVALHTGPNGVSAADSISFTTVSAAFSAEITQHDDNVIQYNPTLMAQFRKAVDYIVGAIETAGATFIQANKTTVNANNDRLGTWNATPDAFEIAIANQNNWFYIAKDNMFQNNYAPTYDVIMDNYMYFKYQELNNQGAGNATNYGWQFSETRGALCNSLTIDSYKGVSYWMPTGSLGLLTWIPEANRRGDQLANFDMLGTFTDPRYPFITFALSMYQKRVDMASAGGNVQAFPSQFELSVDYSFKKAPLSASGETVIHKVALLTT